MKHVSWTQEADSKRVKGRFATLLHEFLDLKNIERWNTSSANGGT